MGQSLQRAPPARKYHESVVLNDRMFVWGGTSEPLQYHSRLDMFNVNMLTGEWHQHTVTPPETPTPCQQACSAAIGNTIYSYGGLTRKTLCGDYTFYDQLYKLNLKEMRWRTIEDTGTKPKGRCGAGMCSMNGKLLVMGGYGVLPSQVTKHRQAQYKKGGWGGKHNGWNNELYEVNPQTGRWSPIFVTGYQPSPRSGHTLTAVDEKRAILVGGSDGEKLFNDLWLFHCERERKEWSFIRASSPLWPQPREGHTVCTMVSDSQEIKVLLMGGYGSDQEILRDCWLLDVIRGIGEPVMIDGVRWSRRDHSAGCVTLSDGTVVVSVFGGCTTSGAISEPCFYQWDPCDQGMLHFGLAPTGAVLRLTEHMGENSKLREEPSAFLQQIEQSRKELSLQVQENDKQRIELKAMESQIRLLQMENTERIRNEAELEQKIEELEQKNQERVTQIQSLKEQKAGLSQTVSLQQTQLVTNATLAEEKDKHIQDISRRNAELRQQNEELEQKNEEQVTQIQSLKEQKTGLSQTVSLQQTQLEANATLAEEKDKHIQDISRRNAELKQQNEEQSTHIQLFEDTEIGDGSADSSDRTVKPVTISVSYEIGEEEATVNFPSSTFSLYVSKGAVPPATSFSLKTYVDPRVLPPLTSKDEVTLSPTFQLSSSLPQGHLSLKKPLLLSLSPEVPLSAGDRDNGWLLQLKRSECSDGLPDEWHTMLEINTKTGEFISHSSNSQYDPDSHAVYLYQLPWLSWIGRPLETVGNVVGSSSSSLRDINYAVFGKQIQHHKWLIAAHILHKSETVYKSLVHNLREEGYVQLNHPNTDCIGPNGEVSFQVECKAPWQVQQGKREVRIKTSRIWGSGQHASCYHEFTVEDHTCSAHTLEFTIEASFQTQGERDAGHPVQLIVSHPLCALQPTTCIATESGVSDEFYDPQLVLSAVLKHGPECWFPIGLKLGFTAGQVKAITFAIPRDEDKLTALFETKANALGRDEAAKQLLDACGTILNPILGVVMDELTGASKEGRSEGKLPPLPPLTGTNAVEKLMPTDPVLVAAVSVLVIVLLRRFC